MVVVIPTFNHAQKLPPLLTALTEQTLDPDRFEVVVVDDCSTDGTPEVLEELKAELPYPLRALRTERNTGGPAAPRNLGWRCSKAPVVAFLDDDCLPAPQWLESALTDIETNPDWGVTQGKTIATRSGRLVSQQVARLQDRRQTPAVVQSYEHLLPPRRA